MVHKIELEKCPDGRFYVHHNKGSRYGGSSFFINRELAINYADRLRGALEAQGYKVKTILPPGSMAH